MEQEKRDEELREKELKREISQDELAPAAQNDSKINPSNIDAHWLHSQLSKLFDPTEAQAMQ